MVWVQQQRGIAKWVLGLVFIWFMIPWVVKEFLLGSRVAENTVVACLPELFVFPNSGQMKLVGQSEILRCP
jgi:hypothetical protein